MCLSMWVKPTAPRVIFLFFQLKCSRKYHEEPDNHYTPVSHLVLKLNLKLIATARTLRMECIILVVTNWSTVKNEYTGKKWSIQNWVNRYIHIEIRIIPSNINTRFFFFFSLLKHYMLSNSSKTTILYSVMAYFIHSGIKDVHWCKYKTMHSVLK